MCRADSVRALVGPAIVAAVRVGAHTSAKRIGASTALSALR